MAEETVYHVPVLLKESVDGLNITEGGNFVDVTFGGGGHIRAAGCVVNGNLSDIKSDMLKEIGKQCQ